MKNKFFISYTGNTNEKISGIEQDSSLEKINRNDFERRNSQEFNTVLRDHVKMYWRINVLEYGMYQMLCIANDWSGQLYRTKLKALNLDHMFPYDLMCVIILVAKINCFPTM